MQKKIIILGLGGQGVLFIGKLLSHTGFLDGYRSTYLPTYGPSVQNGPVKAEVIISSGEIYNPFADPADIVMVLHKQQLAMAEKLITPDGLMITKDFEYQDSQNYQNLAVFTEEITEELKNQKIGNVVMFGALSAVIGTFSDNSVGTALKQILLNKPYQMVSLNFKAYKMGRESIKLFSPNNA